MTNEQVRLNGATSFLNHIPLLSAISSFSILPADPFFLESSACRQVRRDRLALLVAPAGPLSGGRGLFDPTTFPSPAPTSVTSPVLIAAFPSSGRTGSTSRSPCAFL